MLERFEFMTAGRIIFGAGVLKELPRHAEALGKRALVVTGRDSRRAAPVFDLLTGAAIAYEVFSVNGEPSVQTACEGVAQARAFAAELIIGVGGGGALDAAKAIAALATNPGDPLDYLEVVGKAQPLINAPLPYIAIPTTAGTGSEATRNAVLTAEAQRVKVSLRSPLMLPRLALIDPTLTHTLPPSVTASSGLDALTQLIEPFISRRANPLTDALCREGLTNAAWALPRAYAQGDDAEAREAMAYASLFSGMALANAGLGVVHGFAAPIGGMFGAPHGMICASLLPHGMAANVRALRAQDDTFARDRLMRFEEIALLLDAESPEAEAAVSALCALCERLNVPRLRDLGVRREAFSEIVQKAKATNSMKANPVALSDFELHAILDAAW
ncbi:MAG: alcohol dehydrogenase [Candidatus Thermofonsia Clade 1 bacterium]|uniref:Alcohol dehydrogenase n=1 Tax=Candidatus Thermofonsia Clade 1 bacterium TaxID=2364210 RepID=A0A2M8PZN7_9CHLR|nr:MAG: alcohol dehydrogenase [Candidatus Thermofonsia Clade 1 bacterium]PJF43015.1 MAG: alcohol dehydrogenase [Candidatus Thermofonsia Clade 1 bacterium]